MDPIYHAIIPALVLLSLRFDPKLVLSLLPFAVVPDIDVIFGLWAHRVVFHNFIIFILIPILVFIYVRKYYPKKLKIIGISWFFLISHMVLDFESGFAMFWPFSTRAPYISFNITITMGDILPRLFLNLNYGLSERAPEYTGTGSLLAPTTSLLIILLSIAFITNRNKIVSFFFEFKDFLLEKLSLLR